MVEAKLLGISINSVIEEYIYHKDERRKKQGRYPLSTFTKYNITRVLKRLLLSSLSPREALEVYVKDKSLCTQKWFIWHAKAFFNWMVELDKLQANPLTDLRLPKIEHSHNDLSDIALSKQDYRRLMRKCETIEEKILVRLIGEAGLMKYELWQIRQEDIKGNILHISGRRKRAIPLSHNLAKAVDRSFADKPREYLFPYRGTEKRHEALTKILDRAGLRKRGYAYKAFRATCLLEGHYSGTPLEILLQRLNYSRFDTVRRRMRRLISLNVELRELELFQLLFKIYNGESPPIDWKK